MLVMQEGMPNFDKLKPNTELIQFEDRTGTCIQAITRDFAESQSYYMLAYQAKFTSVVRQTWSHVGPGVS